MHERVFLAFGCGYFKSIVGKENVSRPFCAAAELCSISFSSNTLIVSSSLLVPSFAYVHVVQEAFVRANVDL